MRICALMLVATVVALGDSPSPASASAFFGWQVAAVPAGDLLNVRAYPSNKSKTLVGYPNGTRLSLTGRCTGGLHLDAISGQSSQRQQQAVRDRWCQIWLDPTGEGRWRPGWVYGRFIRPL
jgi:hypothetical protein